MFRSPCVCSTTPYDLPTTAAAQGVLTWAPKALTATQARTLDAVAELIMPATDTPGAGPGTVATASPRPSGRCAGRFSLSPDFSPAEIGTAAACRVPGGPARTEQREASGAPSRSTAHRKEAGRL